MPHTPIRISTDFTVPVALALGAGSWAINCSKVTGGVKVVGKLAALVGWRHAIMSRYLQDVGRHVSGV